MKIRFFFLAIFTIISELVLSQNYPVFGNEIKVKITGLTFDAMEPFISLDGSTLFFNSLNSGGNTNLYYATKINDSTFNYVGLVGNIYDSSPNHLDGVASIDSLNNFFWVSLRGYPVTPENLHRGVYSGGSVSNITRVYGDFNIYYIVYPFGWLIMDGTISFQGDLLYYNNAKIDFANTSCINVPCESKIGVAQKVNDSLFNKHPNSNAIFSKVNDTINYLIYAPQVTKDGLELYYSRLLKNTTNTEICVSVRSNVMDTFSLPMVIHSNPGFIPEAATPTLDKEKIFYHQKDESGIFHIYLRYRTGTTLNISEHKKNGGFGIYPNPINNVFNVRLPNAKLPFVVTILSVFGEEIYKISDSNTIDISNFVEGMYLLNVNQDSKSWVTKIIKD